MRKLIISLITAAAIAGGAAPAIALAAPASAPAHVAAVWVPNPSGHCSGCYRPVP